MKSVLLSILVVGLVAAQASASMYILDQPTAQQFTQQNTPDVTRNQLYLVIDRPGTLGSNIDWQYDSSWKKYGPTMQLEVGFLGQLADTEVMMIGMDGALPTPPSGGLYDSFGIQVANDDDDYWSVRPYLMGATYAQPALTNLSPGEQAFITLPNWSGDVTGFGFELNYEGERGSDNFHVSVVPIPAASLLGLLGLGATGLMLRKFT